MDRLAKYMKSRLRDRGQKKNGGDPRSGETLELSKSTQRESLQDPRTLVRVIAYVNTKFCTVPIKILHDSPFEVFESKDLAKAFGVVEVGQLLGPAW